MEAHHLRFAKMLIADHGPDPFDLKFDGIDHTEEMIAAFEVLGCDIQRTAGDRIRVSAPSGESLSEDPSASTGEADESSLS